MEEEFDEIVNEIPAEESKFEAAKRAIGAIASVSVPRSITPGMVASALELLADWLAESDAALVGKPGREELPTAQEGQNGTPGSYIYSTQAANKSAESARTAVVVLRNSGFYTVNGALQLRLGVWGQGVNGYFSEAVPIASASKPGIITKETAAKIDALPTAAELRAEMNGKADAGSVTALTDAVNGKVDKVSGKGLSTHDFSSQWLTRLSNAGVYSRSSANTCKSFNASSNVFGLSKASAQSDIIKALTDYETGNILTAEDFSYCAANGCMIYNAATQGFVQVTSNGGGFYNLIEVSFTNYGSLPRMRFICLRALEGGTWQVMRAGQEERVCFYSELDALMQRVNALEQR